MNTKLTKAQHSQDLLELAEFLAKASGSSQGRQRDAADAQEARSGLVCWRYPLDWLTNSHTKQTLTILHHDS